MWHRSDERLFERFRQRRDAAALAEVFDRTAPALLRVALHLCHDRHAAEDLVQQTFLVAIEKAASFDAGRGLFAWLVGILTNRARLHRRAQQRTLPAERQPERSAERPDDAAERRELEHEVENAIAELGDSYRPVLHLHLFHGLNAREIATAIGRPAGSVRTQLVRGLERLRRALPIGLGATAALGSALPAMRRRLLETLPAGANTGALASASLLGGMMTKKLLLFAPLVLLTAFATWQVLVTPAPARPDPAVRAIEPATAELPGTTATVATRNLTALSPHRTEVGRTADRSTANGSLLVRVQFAGSKASAQGTWLRLRSEPWRHGGHRIGARADQRGQARFEDVPAGRWRVLAETGWVESSSTLDIEAGREHELLMTLEPATEVTVRVVDEAERPVEGAEVWVSMAYLGRVWPMAVTTRLAAHTDEHGLATVAGGRETRVGARKAGYAATLSTKVGGASGETVRLQLGREHGSLRGSVTDETGVPIPAAEIYLCAGEFDQRSNKRRADGREDSPPASLHTRPTTDGTFDFAGLRPGRHHLIAVAPRHLDATVDIDVRGFERAPVRIVMRRAERVNVRTTRPDGSPIAGLLVYGRDPQGNICGGGSITDGDGRFGFWAPLAGYRVEVRRGRELVARRHSEAPLTGPVDVDIVVAEHLLVRGRVVDDQRQPLADWRVVALAEHAPPDEVTRAFAFAQSVRTDAEGSFELQGDLAGTLQVVALGPGSFAARDMTTLRPVAVGSDGLELVVPTARLPRSTVTGRVVDTSGMPLTTATVRRLDEASRPIACPDGTFRIEGLVHGELHLYVVADGFGGRRRTIDVDAVTTRAGDIVLQPAVELRVRPVFPAGTEWRGPLPRASIRHQPDGRRGTLAASTVVDGELVFAQLPPGKYLLRPHHDEEIAGDPIPFELQPGAPLQLDWPIRVGRKRHVVFIAPPDRPAAAGTMLRVVIEDAKGTVVHREDRKVSDNAWAVWRTFVPGTYQATASSDAGHRFEGTFEVELDRGDKRIDIPARR